MAELAPQIEALSDDFDVPHAAEYYGYIISEFVVTNVISPKDLVTKFCPKKVTKETTHNLFMTGVLKELSRLDDPDGPAFVEQHAIVLKRGFRLEPKNYDKPVAPNRRKLPSAEELPIIQVVLG